MLDIIDEKIKPCDIPEIHRSEFSEPDGIVEPYVEQKMPIAMPLFAMGIKDNAAKLNRSQKVVIASELLLETVAGKIL